MANPFEILTTLLPVFGPTLNALVCTSIVIVCSNAYRGGKKVAFQSFFFVAAVSWAISFVGLKQEDLKDFFNAFSKLDYYLRFALSVVAIFVAYFGGGMYLGGPSATPSEDSQSSETPASCDRAVDFVVPASLPADDKDFFDMMLTKITSEIIEDLPEVYEMPTEAVEWVKRMINYNVAGGKMNRGLTVLDVQQTFAKAHGRPITNKERCQSAALGWCVEFLQAFFLVADDAMDDSVTRRGHPCWFRLPEVKLISINDSFILESCVYKILKRYLGREKYYPQLVDLFIETTRQTELGQLLDLTSQPLVGAIDLHRFTVQRYRSIVKYKTAFYSFYLPVALGMIVSGISDVSMYAKAREILLIMGEYFQIQDDYLDCYGAPEVIGKIGTDIEDNKCSWLVVQALSRATEKQRKVLEVNYGKHDAKKIENVKNLFVEMELEKAFKTYEEESYAEIQKLLGEVKSMPTEVFTFLLGRIYKRAK